MQTSNACSAPYYTPEVVRDAALRFIDRIETGAPFPQLASGSVILGPEDNVRYETWCKSLEQVAQAIGEDVERLYGLKWDRSTYLLTELMRTLIADPILWCDSGIPQSATVLSSRAIAASSAALYEDG
ncbi:hypothetical protein AK830_g8326 [Neonectria ditissima]|uniref:Uncharacterized protein n=1 Tax=Neonectria ditissima TaxID=78410 RepID=A0A0P7BBM1_9HYPO|nr:hypothetical protein AK830_g8326 [Neonectria ditissima]